MPISTAHSGNPGTKTCQSLYSPNILRSDQDNFIIFLRNRSLARSPMHFQDGFKLPGPRVSLGRFMDDRIFKNLPLTKFDFLKF